MIHVKSAEPFENVDLPSLHTCCLNRPNCMEVQASGLDPIFLVIHGPQAGRAPATIGGLVNRFDYNKLGFHI